MSPHSSWRISIASCKAVLKNDYWSHLEQTIYTRGLPEKRHSDGNLSIGTECLFVLVHARSILSIADYTMVIGLLAITAIPTVTGVGQAVSAQKKANAANKEKEKFHLTAVVQDGEEESDDYETDFCVLKDGKVCYATTTTLRQKKRLVADF